MFFGAFEILFSMTALVILVVIVIVAVRGIGAWSRNNQSPRLTVEARAVAKRTKLSQINHANGGMGHTTTYYVTFQVESGDRMELQVSGREYGVIAEGDSGKLSFQGTRFLQFERTVGSNG